MCAPDNNPASRFLLNDMNKVHLPTHILRKENFFWRNFFFFWNISQPTIYFDWNVFVSERLVWIVSDSIWWNTICECNFFVGTSHTHARVCAKLNAPYRAQFIRLVNFSVSILKMIQYDWWQAVIPILQLVSMPVFVFFLHSYINYSVLVVHSNNIHASTEC